MLVLNYKPTCTYSFTVMLAFSHEPPLRRTLRYQWLFAHHQLNLRPTTAKATLFLSSLARLRPRHLPRHGLALVGSSIQSP
jgi:hypothetical protein